jgi:hypothetical protein
MFMIPRPVSPKSLLADLKVLFAGPMPHKWPVLVLSIVLTSVIIWALQHDVRGPKSERQIIYVESWMADRKDSLILQKQKADLARYEAALQRKQKEFQNVADRFGVEWRADEERNRVQRAGIIAAVNKRLDQRIAAARAREARETGGKPAQTATPSAAAPDRAEP